MQHHLRLTKRGGVYGKTRTGRTELGRQSRYVAPLEGGISYAGDCARAEVRSRVDSQLTRPARRNRGPSIRHRARQALTLAEREDISRGIAADDSARSIAARIGRAPSTVSREITRHGGRSSYRATEADEGAWKSALRPKPCVLALNGTLRNIVLASWAWTGRPSKWPRGSSSSIPTMSVCECPTKPSIAACSSKRGAC